MIGLSRSELIKQHPKLQKFWNEWHQLLGAQQAIAAEISAYTDEVRTLTWQLPAAGQTVTVRDEHNNIVTQDATKVSAAAKRLDEIRREKSALAARKNALTERAKVYGQLLDRCVNHIQQQRQQ